MAAPTHSKVLLILFDGFNTLDMNGPYEVLRKSGVRTGVKIEVAAESEITTSVEGVHVKVFSRSYASHVALVTDHNVLARHSS